MAYDQLFQPLKVGSTILRNRIVAAPITKYGYQPAPAEELEIIASKARGGAGLVILGSVAVNDNESLIYKAASSLDGTRRPLYLEELSIIHQYGAKASVELLHCGMFADCSGNGLTPIGPQTSRIPVSGYKGHEGILKNVPIEVTRAVEGMDRARIERVVQEYAQQALTAKRMGFDMVMLHFAHGWFPAQFMSPFFNERTDEFGGSFENRIRFPRMIIDGVRAAVGPDYPLDMRIGCDEYVEGGLGIDEVVKFIQLVQDKLDMVHISSGLDKLLGPTSYIESPSVHPHLINTAFSERVKKAVNIPVVVVGGMTMPDEAERVLIEGKADAIALGRALIADAMWPEKARENRAADIRACLRCVSCYTVATENFGQGCAVNPRYERELRLTTQEKPAVKKNIVVIGGGPGGMIAAISAAERGHAVTLLEKSNALGGLLKISDGDALKQDMQNYKSYLLAQMEKYAIDVRLNTEATPEYVRALTPDKVVVAIGSEPIRPAIPGVDSAHVLDIVTAHGLLDSLGDHVAIIGGGASGCELGLALARMGRKVTIIEQSTSFANAGNILYQKAMEILLEKEKNIELMLNARCCEILDNTVNVQQQSGEILSIKADNVVLAVGMRPNREAAQAYIDIAYDVRLIGDCKGIGRINEATHEGYFAGYFA